VVREISSAYFIRLTFGPRNFIRLFHPLSLWSETFHPLKISSGPYGPRNFIRLKFHPDRMVREISSA